jgi:hypothetical protein
MPPSWSPVATRRATPHPPAPANACCAIGARQAHLPLPAGPPRPAGQRHQRPTLNADTPAPADRTGLPRYAPDHGARERVSAGHRRTQQPSPEPCAQVRILPGALVRGINSNTLTILSGFSASAVTCGNAGAFQTLRPIRALRRKAGPANRLLSSIARSRSLGRKQAVAPVPTLQLNGGGLHPKHPPTRGLSGGQGNLSHLLGTGTEGLIGR